VNDALTRTRLLTLTGTGGIGKTRLSMVVANALIESYPDGVWLIELAPIRDAELVAAAVAKVLGVQEEAGWSPLDALVKAVKEQHMLLILDNCEHLIGASAVLANDLLRACPNLQILATSREPLKAPGERVYHVGPLSLSKDLSANLPGYLDESEAAQLFEDRATAASADFFLSDRNAQTVADICRDLDGIPLAIELAAARVRTLSLDSIAIRLVDRFSLLRGHGRAVSPRQETLHATIDWSYDLLTAPERDLFARVSVFAGGFDLAAVEALCASSSDESVFDTLDALIDKSLVFVVRAPDEYRYGLLESLRQYASEKLLEHGERESVTKRHRDYYLSLTEHAWPALIGPEQSDWMQRIEREHDNCRAALRWSISEGDAAEALRLAIALERFWEKRGYLTEGREWISRLEELTGPDAPAELRGRVLECGGRLARFQADYPSARRQLEQALAIFRESGDRAHIASTLSFLGIVLMRQGDLLGARTAQEENLQVCRELGDIRGAAAALLNLGNITRREGDHKRSVALRKESLALYRKAGDQSGVALALLNLAAITLDSGDCDGATSYVDESLKLARELGDWFIITRALYGLSEILLTQEQIDGARRMATEGLLICREQSESAGIAYGLEALAAVAVQTSHAEEGGRLLGAAAALRELISAPLVTVADRRVLDLALAKGSAALGEKAFAAAEAAGRATDVEAAINEAIALDAIPAEPGAEAPPAEARGSSADRGE
jgi:predicted ATPase